MDKYTLMCNKLKQLYDYPKIRQIIIKEKTMEEHLILRSIDMGPEPGGWDTFNLTTKKYDYLDEEEDIWFIKPSLEDLIEMLEDMAKDNEDAIFICGAKGSYEAKRSWGEKLLKANTTQEALLKLVAYKRWGLVWSDEKADWEEK